MLTYNNEKHYRSPDPNPPRPLRCLDKKFTMSCSNLIATNWFHSLPSQRFQTLLTLFPKSFSPFPHGTCFLSVSSQYLALEECHLPFSAPSPKYATLKLPTVCIGFQRNTGLSPSLAQSSKLTYAGSNAGKTYQDYNSQTSL